RRTACSRARLGSERMPRIARNLAVRELVLLLVVFMNFAQLYKTELIQAIESVDLDTVGQAIQVLARARDEGRRIFVCGNGGSASTASHFATDLVKGASYGRDARFRIMALTDSLPTITAYSNDVSYDCIFVEQMKNFAEPGDVLLAISS